MADCPPFRRWKEQYQAAEHEKRGEAIPVEPDEDEISPLESMQKADHELRGALEDELLQAVMQKDPYFFEHLVGRLLVAMGYGESLESTAMVTAKSGDEGIDGIVKEDRLGFDNIYYQAKRWDLDRTVSRPDLQAFVGALSGKGASKGLFITTASFSRGAREYAEGLKSQRLVLVDGKALAGMMIDYGVGVSTVATYSVRSLDSDFFADESGSVIAIGYSLLGWCSNACPLVARRLLGISSSLILCAVGVARQRLSGEPGSSQRARRHCSCETRCSSCISSHKTGLMFHASSAEKSFRLQALAE